MVKLSELPTAAEIHEQDMKDDPEYRAAWERAATYKIHNPISLAPAPGWRAAFIHDDGDGRDGYSTEPLLAWCVCEVTDRPCIGSSAESTKRVNEIHGLVMAGYAQCAEETENFWRFLGPGEEPAAAEVKAEQASRAAAGRRHPAS